MSGYVIELSQEAKDDLQWYTALERKTVVAAIRLHLIHEPEVETRNRKRLRENPIAAWCLRSGKYRVFYEVDHDLQTVRIVAVGHKVHNILLIRGEQVQL